MSKPSERLPEGVPTSFDWSTHPRVRGVVSRSGFHAFTAWGQLYQCAGSRPVGNQAVELRRLQTWVLFRGARRWRRIQLASEMHGDAFAEDFSGPTLPARYLATPAATIDRPVAGHNFHFWPLGGRVSLNASRVAAVVVALEARLARSSAPGRPAPCRVLSAGGDLWTSVTAQPGAANQDVGIGRFKRVQRRWRVFTMTTAPARLLRRVPVPSIAPADEDF
jgi:hypothetical protein